MNFFVFRIVHLGILDFGFWTLDFALWALDFELGDLDLAVWASDFGSGL